MQCIEWCFLCIHATQDLTTWPCLEAEPLQLRNGHTILLWALNAAVNFLIRRIDKRHAEKAMWRYQQKLSVICHNPMNLGVPRAEAQRDKQRFILRAFRGLLIGHLDFRLLTLTKTVRTDCCCFNHPFCGIFLVYGKLRTFYLR